MTIARADFTGDGCSDVLVARVSRDPSGVPLELYVGRENGTFVLDQTRFSPTVPLTVHPRKILLGDYNEDGHMDALIADHGWDQPPYPGAMPVLLLSAAGGKLRRAELPPGMKGFNHGAGSADINGDGHVDLYLTASGTFYLNDGGGDFRADVTRTPGDLRRAAYTCELLDLDQDGYMDLLLGGHEFEGRPSSVLWGNSTGVYSHENETVFPAVQGWGVVVDIDAEDLNADGRREVVLTRTRDNPFYEGYYLQLLHLRDGRQVDDETASRLPTGTDTKAPWIYWLRLMDCDRDGDIDIATDDTSRDWVWLNDGTGHFQRR